MKKFEDLKIAGCVMCHDGDYDQIVLDDIGKYANLGIYVNLNSPTKKVIEAVEQHPAVKLILRTTNEGRWNQGLQRDNTMRMLDDVQPDIVLFPDSDELYPPNMWEQLRTFWEDEKAVTFWFRLLYLWGDENHFRNDGYFKCIHHVRAMKWQPGITYHPKYAGYACPTNYIHSPKESRFHSNMPTIHYGYEQEKNRIAKLSRGNCDYCDPEVREKIDQNMIIREIPPELKPKQGLVL